ncbi:MAG: cyanoexosortase A [Leptolyngbyaceae bacterium]|nr:cyanoexosortase A [Leptolyngbyaceae bacterium]
MLSDPAAKANSLEMARLLKNPKVWFLGIIVSLISLHLSLTWSLTKDADRLSISVLVWAAVIYLLWNKRSHLNVQSEAISSFFGLLLTALVLVKSVSVFWFESDFLRILPLVAALGVGLLASGIRGLKQYGQEFLIISLLAIPDGLLLGPIEKIFQVSLITAKFSGLILWYLGFEISRQGVVLILPTGAVEVNPGCNGLNTMFLLFRLSIIFLIMFPFNSFKRFFLPLIAVLLAFMINSVRVGLLALLVSYSNLEAFEYWHLGTGSQIFAMIAVIAFAWVCSLLGEQEEFEAEEFEAEELEAEELEDESPTDAAS